MEISYIKTDNNFEIKEKEVLVEINTKTYNFEVILTTIYPLLEENYIIIDGDKDKIIKLRIKPKRSDIDKEELVGKFFNRLNLNLIHQSKMKENKEYVDTIMKTSLERYHDQIK